MSVNIDACLPYVAQWQPLPSGIRSSPPATLKWIKQVEKMNEQILHIDKSYWNNTVLEVSLV